MTDDSQLIDRWIVWLLTDHLVEKLNDMYEWFICNYSGTGLCKCFKGDCFNFQPFGHHFLYTKITGRVLKMCQPWLQTQLTTPKPGKSWPQHQLGKCCKKRGARSGPHPLLSSTQSMGTSKIADLASVPGPVAAVSLLPGVSAMRFLQRARHGASPSGRFAAGGASPAVLWLRGAPPSSTHGPNEEANAVMTPPWWMEKRETWRFPTKMVVPLTVFWQTNTF